MQQDEKVNEQKMTESPMEDAVCGICFTGIHPSDNPRGRLNSCSHLFCAYCIKEWAQSTNVCPHCKARFTRIFVLNENGEEEITKVRKRNYRRWEEDEEEDVVENGEGDVNSAEMSESMLLVACDVCGQGDNAFRMIFCDRRQCQYAVHLDCINLSERPAEFYCAQCVLLRGGTITTPTTPISTSVSYDDHTQTDNNNSNSNNTTTTTSTSTTTMMLDSEMKEKTESFSPVGEMQTNAIPPCKTQYNKISVPLPAFLRQAMERGVRGQTTAGQQQQQQQQQQGEYQGKEMSASSSSTLGVGFPRINSSFSSSQNRGRGRGIGGMGGDRELNIVQEDDTITRSSQAALEEYLKRQEMQNNHTRLRQEHRGEIPQSRDMHLRGIGVVSGQHALKRPRSSNNNNNNNIPIHHVGVDALLNPNTRRKEEERLARQIAIEMLPVLRRNQQIQESQLQFGRNGDITVASTPSESDTALRERELYVRAMTEARRMAQQQIEAKVVKARMRMERHVRIQAQREAAALAKLAKIVASHRIAPKPN